MCCERMVLASGNIEENCNVEERVGAQKCRFVKKKGVSRLF